MRIGVHKHCNLSGRCPELPTSHRPPVPRWASRMQQHGSAARGAAGSTQHCAQRAGLNGVQKAPRREFKLEFGYVWAFPPERCREVDCRWRQAVLRHPEESPRCERGAVNTRQAVSNWLFIMVGSFQKAELGFPGCLMFAICIDFSWCWYTLDCFRSVGAAAVPSLLHVIAEHNNLTGCSASLLLSSSLSLALSLHCNALRTGLSLVLCAAAE